jgi:dephospho-CoA kinase
MIKVGITGGIGSGKTIVCKIFEAMGIPVYNADRNARRLINTQPEIRDQLIARFGSDIYQNNQIDRKKLAGIIFANPDAVGFVNSVVHPAVSSDFMQWAEQQKNVPYVMDEAALLFESGGYKLMDIMVTVTAPETIRIDRAMQRDGATEEAIRSRIKNQLSEEEKIKLSDFVINNTEEFSLLQQTLALHNYILSEKWAK